MRHGIAKARYSGFSYDGDVEGVHTSSTDEFGCDHAGNLAERTGMDGDTVTRSVQHDHFGRLVIRAHVHTREIVTRDGLEKPARSSSRLCVERDKCRAVPND